jgi:hypothetical protein
MAVKKLEVLKIKWFNSGQTDVKSMAISVRGRVGKNDDREFRKWKKQQLAGEYSHKTMLEGCKTEKI